MGTGKIAASAHLPAALAAPGIDVVALVDPVLGRARALAQHYGIAPRLAASVSEVVGDIDGAVIATPNNSHCQIAVECCRAGVSTLIEKPLAVSVREGEAIARAAKEAGVVVAVGYVTRFYDGVGLLADLIATGYFGRVHRFAYQSGSAGRWAPLSGYTLDRAATGGGVLVVTGTHFLDRMLYWFGYPDGVEYQDDSLGGPEANVLARFRYAAAGGRASRGACGSPRPCPCATGS